MLRAEKFIDIKIYVPQIRHDLKRDKASNSKKISLMLRYI